MVLSHQTHAINTENASLQSLRNNGFFSYLWNDSPHANKNLMILFIYYSSWKEYDLCWLVDFFLTEL